MADCQSVLAQITATQLQIRELQAELSDLPKGPRTIQLEQQIAALTQQLASLQQQRAQCTVPGVYRCDDGGAYYVRQLGDAFYWFGERADGAFANLFVGHRSGNGVTGNWYDLPKGASHNAGTLSLTVDDAAGTITRVSQSGGFGGAHWQLDTPYGANAVARANAGFRQAQYQGDGQKNLTGTWMSQTGSRSSCDGTDSADPTTTFYLRQIDPAPPPLPNIHPTVVWYAESCVAAQLFVGTRDGRQQTVSGTWVELPRFGAASSSGSVTFGLQDWHLIRQGNPGFPISDINRVESLALSITLDQLKIDRQFAYRPVSEPVGSGSTFPSPPRTTAVAIGDTPFLWVVLVKVDGSTVSVANYRLSNTGEPTVISPPGSHHDLTAGQKLLAGTTLPIPPALGHVETTVTTVRGFPAPVSGALVTTSKDATQVAFVLVALQQNDTPDNAIEAGHGAFLTALRDKIKDVLRSGGTEPVDVQSWFKDLQSAVHDAVRATLTTWQALTTVLGFSVSDQFVGSDYRLYSYKQLEAMASEGRIHLNFYLPPPSGQQYYEVSGVLITRTTPLWPIPLRPPVLNAG